MKKYFLLLITFFSTLLSFAQDDTETIDQTINDSFEPVTTFISDVVFYAFNVTVNGETIAIPLIIIWLLGGAIFFTLFFKFVNVRKFLFAINVVRGKYNDPNDKGEVSHFQALTTALSGTVGLGNIAGVAVAISQGGPGATFWLIVVGLLGMSTKFVECTLGVKYRKIDRDGTVHGGPMYYLSQGLEKRNLKTLGKVLAGLFAVLCIGGSLGGGNMFQANQAYKQFASLDFMQGTWISDNAWFFGIIMSVLVAIVILGGIKSIARVTDKIVPFMVAIYVLGALTIIFTHYKQIDDAFMLIITQAFNPVAIKGGFLGVLIIGIQRAVFSNEAGVGSASIAHSAVKTDHPASEGIVSLLEPLIDTVVVCTMTAIVIVISGKYTSSISDVDQGVTLTSEAFGTVITWFPYVLAMAVVLFAFSTMISWSYYGLQAWTYLFGNSRRSDSLFKIIFCSFIIVGSASSLSNVIGFSDAMLLGMSFPNIIGLIILSPVVKDELNKYISYAKHFTKKDK